MEISNLLGACVFFPAFAGIWLIVLGETRKAWRLSSDSFYREARWILSILLWVLTCITVGWGYFFFKSVDEAI